MRFTGRLRSIDAVLGAEPDRDLFAALKARRLELARERGVPPYVIFHDRTLVAMGSSKPATLGLMACISGVGEKKLEAYGEIFLGVIREFR